METLVDGEGKRKAGSVAIILRLNRSSMRFNDGPNDREAHSEAFFFCREKLIEELLEKTGKKVRRSNYPNRQPARRT